MLIQLKSAPLNLGALTETEIMEITDRAAAEDTWKAIELSESYLVCSMYEEAESSASSILKRLHDECRCISIEEAAEVRDMLESIGMVLVQSLKELGRTSEIVNQLRMCFMSVTSIPVQVLLAGACFQIAEGSSFGIREVLEEFLSKWSLVDEQYCTVIADENPECESRYDRHFVLDIDRYLEVVEVYAVTLLAAVLNDVDNAISWVKKASLPEDKRLDFLRRLQVMNSRKTTILSQNPFLQMPINNDEAYSLKELNTCEYEVPPKALKGIYQDDKKYNSKEVLLKLSEGMERGFWCFPAINLKFGRARFVISSKKVMLGCLILLSYYVFRKKQATIKRIIRRQTTAAKRALVDLWQLAFSYQVNPLAAVQVPTLSAAAGTAGRS